MFAKPEQIIKGLNLKPGMKVADLGSGVGFYAIEAAKQVAPTGRVYAVDIQSGLLERLKQEAGLHQVERLVEVIEGDFEQIGGSGIEEGAVDAVIIANVLFQADEPSKMIGEAGRILRPGGRGLLVDWSDSFGGLGPAKDHVLTKTRAQTLLDESGLKTEGEIDVGSYHYGLVFTK